MACTVFDLDQCIKLWRITPPPPPLFPILWMKAKKIYFLKEKTPFKK